MATATDIRREEDVRALREALGPPATLDGPPDPSRPARRLGPAGRVVVIGATCFLLWILLAAPGLKRDAETSPPGIRRTASLAMLRPPARFTATSGRDRRD